MKEAEFPSKTGTFGPTAETREFTEDEKVVLKHFFTNIDKNVYAATDNMPNCLWALLVGGYSRSHLSLRMRFLEIFQEMEQEHQTGKLAQEDLITLKQFAENISSGNNINMSYFLSKAEKFMRKWAVQYGHDSLKDSDVVRFAVEQITQYATTPLEEARLGAYQEKSTRYIPFSRESLIVPVDLQEFEAEVREWNYSLLDNYKICENIVKEFIKKKLDQAEFKTEAAFQRTVNAKTFDIIRYFLPVTILTSVGVTWPTREAERHISRLMSNSKAEMRAMGKALLEEGKKISPGLLSHVAVNDYQIKKRALINEVNQNINLCQPHALAGRGSDAVKLIYTSPNIEAKIAATILFENCSSGNSYQDYLNLCLNNKELVEKILRAYLESRGKFDPLPLATETGNLIFEVTMDYGAYRDLKRHRRNLLIRSPATSLIGFEYPEYVEHEPELIEVKQRIEQCAAKTTQLYQKVKQKLPHLAEYIVMFAHKQKIIWQMDPRQFAYISELRTTPAGHHSYRTICQEMFKVVKEQLPILCKYIRVDLSSGEEGRKKQEEKTVEKLKALGAELERVN